MRVLCIPCNYLSYLRRRLAAPLQLAEQTPPLQRYRKYHEKGDDNTGAGKWAGLCVCINLIMGSGFLALPSAFVSTGLLLSVAVLACVCMVMDVTVTHEVEVMCRAEAVLHQDLAAEDLISNPGSLTPPAHTHASKDYGYPLHTAAMPIDPEREPLKLRNSGSAGSLPGLLLPPLAPLPSLPPRKRGGRGGGGGALPSRASTLFELRSHAYQVSELCELFGGAALRRAYDVVMIMYMLCTLWGYAAVFGKALASNIAVPALREEDAFLLYVALFAAVVVPLSVMDIREQVQFQVVMTWLRLLTAVSMTGSVTYAWATGRDDLFPSLGGAAGGAWELPLAQWSGLGVAVPAVMFAVMLNSSTPVVVHALAHKPDTSWVVNLAMCAAFILYAVISLPVAGYFGGAVADTCNVNWESFGGEGLEGAGRTLAHALGFFVVLFPALDVLSVYPMNVMVLANNLMAAVYHDRVDKAEQDKTIVAVFRLACAVPPIAAAMVLNSLTQIVDYAGCLAILIALVVPPYLSILSKRECEARFGTATTPFTMRFWSRPAACYAIMGVGLTAFGAQVAMYVTECVSLLWR